MYKPYKLPGDFTDVSTFHPKSGIVTNSIGWLNQAETLTSTGETGIFTSDLDAGTSRETQDKSSPFTSRKRN